MRFYLLSGSHPAELFLRLDHNISRGYVWTEEKDDAAAFITREAAETFRDSKPLLQYKQILCV